MSESPSEVVAGIPDGKFLDRLGSAAEMVGAGRFREAEVEILRGLSIAPSDLRALKLLALVRFKLGRLDEARAVCREIAATLPRDPGIRLKLGLIALKLDRIDESVQELETSARLAPHDLRAWSYLGFAYARRGDHLRAAAAFRRAGQEHHAAEVEQAGASALGGDGAAVFAPTRVKGEGSGPVSNGRDSDPGLPGPPGLRGPPGLPALPGQRAPGGGGSGSGAIPAMSSGAFEPAFDLSVPIDAREPRTDPDGPVSNVRAGTGGIAVSPLIAYAVSRLAPPADQASWVGSTARLAIGDGVFVRRDAAIACTGSARWEDAHRHVRGRPTTERLGGDDRPFFRVFGRGELFVGAPSGRLVPLRLEDDILYVREDRVLAFEGSVSWEYGHVPRGNLRMLQFRGRGVVAIRVDGEPGAVKVTPEHPLFASAGHLLGWIGRVVARGNEPAAALPSGTGSNVDSGPFGITCEGEGVVLIDVADRSRS